MYSAVLLIHSWLRWVVLAAALLTLVRAATGRAQRKPWTRADDTAMQAFTGAIDLQMLLGLLLYVALSPATQAAFEDFGGAMGNAPIRFWAVEHLAGMIVATALAHVGRARVRKTADPRQKHQRALLFSALALVAMLVSIPWPGMANGRPLFRIGS